VQLVDGVLLQGDGFQALVYICESYEGVKRDLFQFIVGKHECGDSPINHVVENEVELVVLHAGADEFDDFDVLPVEPIKESLQIDLF
jgi:hypothetical protein